MVTQATKELTERLRLFETKTIEEGDILLLSLKKINGLFVVDEITNDKLFPITIKSLYNNTERRYDITENQYMMGRIRFLKSKLNMIIIKKKEANE